MPFGEGLAESLRATIGGANQSRKCGGCSEGAEAPIFDPCRVVFVGVVVLYGAGFVVLALLLCGGGGVSRDWAVSVCGRGKDTVCLLLTTRKYHGTSTCSLLPLHQEPPLHQVAVLPWCPWSVSKCFLCVWMWLLLLLLLRFTSAHKRQERHCILAPVCVCVGVCVPSSVVRPHCPPWS